MSEREVKDAIALKTMQFEAAMATQRPHRELMKIYKELKELKYRLLELENFTPKEKDVDLV
jgi:hypothetical protein